MSGRGKPNGARELAETLRNAARRAIRHLEDEGTPLDQILKEAFKERPLDAVKACSSLIPKQMEIEHRDASPFDDLSDDELQSFVNAAKGLAASAGAIKAEAGEEKPPRVH